MLPGGIDACEISTAKARKVPILPDGELQFVESVGTCVDDWRVLVVADFSPFAFSDEGLARPCATYFLKFIKFGWCVRSGLKFRDANWCQCFDERRVHPLLCQDLR